MELKYLFVRRHSDSIKEPTYFELKSYKIRKGRFLNRPLCFMLMWTNMNILWSSLVQTGSDIKILRFRVKMFYRWKIIGGGIHILPTCTFDIFEYWIHASFDNILQVTDILCLESWYGGRFVGSMSWKVHQHNPMHYNLGCWDGP